MSQDFPSRKRIRLEPSAYAQTTAVCSVTIAVRDRRPVFANAAHAEALTRTLRQHANRMGVSIYAYCVMPDHVHLAISPSPACDIGTFVGQLKNLAQREVWKLGDIGAFWQRSYWDHFLRSDESLEALVNYVLNNPVRAGMG